MRIALARTDPHACYSESRARNSSDKFHAVGARGKEPMHFGPICSCPFVRNATKSSKVHDAFPYALLFAYSGESTKQQMLELRRDRVQKHPKKLRRTPY